MLSVSYSRNYVTVWRGTPLDGTYEPLAWLEIIINSLLCWLEFPTIYILALCRKKNRLKLVSDITFHIQQSKILLKSPFLMERVYFMWNVFLYALWSICPSVQSLGLLEFWLHSVKYERYNNEPAFLAYERRYINSCPNCLSVWYIPRIVARFDFVLQRKHISLMLYSYFEVNRWSKRRFVSVE